jgi:Tol biopolymer transport system component
MNNNKCGGNIPAKPVSHPFLRFFLLAVSTVITLSGCGSGGGGGGGSGSATSGGGSSNVAIATSSLATGVVSLDTSTASLIIASDASSVTFAGAPAAILALQPGSIFLVGNTARKVESVISGGGQTVVRTVEPDLSEALDALQISGDVFLGSEHISQASTLAGVRVDILNQKDTTVGTISESNQGNTFVITITDEVIYDADGDLTTKFDQVIANGTVVLEKPHVAFDFNYGLFSEKYTSINFTAGEKVDLTVSSQSIQFDKKKTITLFKYYISTPITGGLAGVTIPVNLVFEASGKAAIVAGFSQDVSIDVGMKATISPNTVTSTSNFTHTFSFKQPQIEGTLSGSIAINPDVDLTAFQYSLAGITNSLGAVATAKGSITLSNACTRVMADAFVSSNGFVMVPKASLNIDFSWSGINISSDLGIVPLNKEIYSYTKNIYDSGDVCLVSNDPPVANAGLDLSSNTNAKVYLDGLKSSDSDGLVASYLWTQVSGTSVALTAASSATPTFTAPTTPGTLTFRLTVTDNKGATGTDDMNVVVYAGDTNKKPNANAGNDQFVVSGSPVALDAGGSYDPDGSIVAYLWEQTGGPAVALIGANTASPSFTAPSISTVLVFKLTVKDNKGAVGVDYVSISVVSVAVDTTAPTVNTTIPVNAASGVSINSGVSVTFSEALDASTINTSIFTLNGPSGLVAGTVTYNTTTNTAAFTPLAALAYNTTYTATITTGAKDLAGNPLASDYSWSFSTISSPVAVFVKTSIAGGIEFTLAIKNDGTVWAWGSNFNGQLGNGTTTYAATSTPAQVSGLVGMTAVAAGGDTSVDQGHGIALKNDGTVWTWGRNLEGQLGDGTFTNRYTPVQVSGLTGIAAIAGGAAHTLALKNDGTVWAWGSNVYGQLGDGAASGARVNRSTPIQVVGLTGVTAVARGAYHSLALKNDGTVWAWGENSQGMLGDGTTASSSTPVKVNGLTGVVAIAGGWIHTVALKNDGTVWAWGDNLQGELGNGTFTDSLIPVQVSGLTSVTAIAAGLKHTLALKSDGTVWAWGYNGDGALGDGTVVIRNTPVKTNGLAGVTAIAAGTMHSIALKNDGTVWTWGGNNYGELGDGTTSYRSTPVQVVGFTGVTVPSGGRIAFTSNRDGSYEIYVMNADGSGQTRLTSDTAHDYNTQPSWSPDGSRIAFSSSGYNLSYAIYVINANGSGRTQLTSVIGTERQPSWSPDGSRIAITVGFPHIGYYGDLDIYVANADGSGQTQLTNNGSEGEFLPAWSPDGTKIVFTSNRYGISIMNADGSGQTPLTNNAAIDGGHTWFPDGTKIAFLLGGDIYVMSADGSGQTPLTNNAAINSGYAWSPNGTKIAFTSNRNGSLGIYVMNADGSGQTWLTNNVTAYTSLVWSPDGTRIAFMSNRDGNPEIYVMNADGSGQTRITNNAAEDTSPVWSPR